MTSDERAWRERGLRDAVRAGDEAAWKTLYQESFAGLVRLRPVALRRPARRRRRGGPGRLADGGAPHRPFRPGPRLLRRLALRHRGQPPAQPLPPRARSGRNLRRLTRPGSPACSTVPRPRAGRAHCRRSRRPAGALRGRAAGQVPRWPFRRRHRRGRRRDIQGRRITADAPPARRSATPTDPRIDAMTETNHILPDPSTICSARLPPAKAMRRCAADCSNGPRAASRRRRRLRVAAWAAALAACYVAGDADDVLARAAASRGGPGAGASGGRPRSGPAIPAESGRPHSAGRPGLRRRAWSGRRSTPTSRGRTSTARPATATSGRRRPGVGPALLRPSTQRRLGQGPRHLARRRLPAHGRERSPPKGERSCEKGS